jgi:hypothetical protein
VISRAWTVYNRNAAEPTFTEAISRAETIHNDYVAQPTFTEAISRADTVHNDYIPPADILEAHSVAVTQCNIGLFADEDNDTVHDCFDICPGGNDLIDADNNNIPDACEPGSCCFMTGGFPGCFNSDKLECESPPFSGVYGGEGSVCDQNVAIINEPSGEVFIHVIGPPADCGPGTPTVCRGISPPPYIDAWKSPSTGIMAHSFNAANGGTPIPAGFFAVGSDPFDGSIALKGVPLNDLDYPGADTLIRRHADPFGICTQGSFPVAGSPVPIEIIALSLASDASAPLTVTYNGGTNPQLWDVTVSLAGASPMGFLTATKEHCNGGTYTSVLNVWPQFTFRRQSTGTLRGLVPPTYMTFNQTIPAPWVHDVNPSFDAAIDPCSQFHAGFDQTYSPLVCGDDPDGDNVRVECDNCPNVSNSLQEDTDNDGLGNVCDNCPNVANSLQEDCDSNGIGDACETTFVDCQPNGVPDSCDIVASTSEDCNINGIPDECEEVPDVLLVNPTGLSATRFITIRVPSGAAGDTALRVQLVSLHHVAPPYTGGPSIPFTSLEGQYRWVGPPVQYVESTSVGTPFLASSLQCNPHYQDWSTVDLLHVTGSAIVPSSQYAVQNVAAACAGFESCCTAMSEPLPIATTRWGDVEIPYSPPSATTQPDVGDIAALVKKFQSGSGAPIKARALLAGEDAFGNINIVPDLSFSHIAACVDAFRGRPYPFTIGACP